MVEVGVPNSLVDIGVNLTNKAFRNDLDDVIERARSAGVERMVLTGTSERASQEAADLAPDRPLRLLRERAAPLASLDTDDAAILDDLDTASDLAALRRRLTGAERPT